MTPLLHLYQSNFIYKMKCAGVPRQRNKLHSTVVTIITNSNITISAACPHSTFLCSACFKGKHYYRFHSAMEMKVLSRKVRIGRLNLGDFFFKLYISASIRKFKIPRLLSQRPNIFSCPQVEDGGTASRYRR